MFLFYCSPSKKVVSPFLPVLLILFSSLLVILLVYLGIRSAYLSSLVLKLSSFWQLFFLT